MLWIYSGYAARLLYKSKDESVKDRGNAPGIGKNFIWDIWRTLNMAFEIHIYTKGLSVHVL